ncbi:MAG TPA: hypothetical protein VKU00_34165 [Chthonomonadaceae bacterium]|nr:hypothetical protein [Chthonomonadaceae bacterium]
MNIQQLIAISIVAMAAVYLGRNLVLSARAFFSKKSSGCPGCGKCAFAPKENRNHRGTETPRSHREKPLIRLTQINTDYKPKREG